jgi:hypothetical protein
MSDMQLPQWSARGRDVFRILIVVYGLIWLARSALALTDLTFDTDIYGDPPSWLTYAGFVFVGAWVLSGLVWLAGAAVAGYQEPKDE